MKESIFAVFMAAMFALATFLFYVNAYHAYLCDKEGIIRFVLFFVLGSLSLAFSIWSFKQFLKHKKDNI